MQQQVIEEQARLHLVEDRHGDGDEVHVSKFPAEQVKQVPETVVGVVGRGRRDPGIENGEGDGFEFFEEEVKLVEDEDPRGGEVRMILPAGCLQKLKMSPSRSSHPS
jgi:hypothetical protein